MKRHENVRKKERERLKSEDKEASVCVCGVNLCLALFQDPTIFFNISSLIPRPIDPTIQNRILKAGNGPGNEAKHISSMSSWEHVGPGNETLTIVRHEDGRVLHVLHPAPDLPCLLQNSHDITLVSKLIL